MRIGAVYIRVSTEEQVKDGYSLDAQLKAIENFAKKNDIIIKNEYIFKDEGISGRIAEKRPAFMNMIKIAKEKQKKFDVILVHKFDRFSRNREDSIVYKSMLKKEHNISVISITEPLDPEDKMSIIIESFLEAMAEYYSINLSGEVKKGQLEKHDKGQLQTKPPFGYNVHNNKLIPNKDEAPIVKLIFEEFSLKHTPITQIAQTLNQLGIKTKKRKSFENRTIKYILNNPVYIGKLRYTDNSSKKETIIVTGKHKPIIDNNLWTLSQKELAKNQKFSKKHFQKNTNLTHWLRGLIRCIECGCTMVTYQKSKLRCNGYNKGKCSNHSTINIEDAYNLIILELKNTMNIDKINSITQRKKKNIKTDIYSILKHKLTILKEKEDRIRNAYLEGIDNLDEYNKNKKLIKSEKENLIEQLHKVSNEETSNYKDHIIENEKYIYEILISDNISTIEKNEIIHLLIDRIIYDFKNNSLILYYN